MVFHIFSPALAVLVLFIACCIMILVRWGPKLCKVRHTARDEDDEPWRNETYEQRVSYAWTSNPPIFNWSGSTQSIYTKSCFSLHWKVGKFHSIILLWNIMLVASTITLVILHWCHHSRFTTVFVLHCALRALKALFLWSMRNLVNSPSAFYRISIWLEVVHYFCYSALIAHTMKFCPF